MISAVLDLGVGGGGGGGVVILTERREREACIDFLSLQFTN